MAWIASRRSPKKAAPTTSPKIGTRNVNALARLSETRSSASNQSQNASADPKTARATRMSTKSVDQVSEETSSVSIDRSQGYCTDKQLAAHCHDWINPASEALDGDIAHGDSSRGEYDIGHPEGVTLEVVCGKAWQGDDGDTGQADRQPDPANRTQTFTQEDVCENRSDDRLHIRDDGRESR